MSGTYQEINLDDDEGKTPDDIEIVNEEVEQTPESEEETLAPEPKTQAAEEDDGEEGGEDQPRGKRTRSQRLKAQRDHYAKLAQEAEERARAAEEKAKRLEQTATDSTAVGMDLLITNLDSELKSLRRDYDVAWDAGDKDKIFDIQTQIAEKVAERKQAERERAAIPTRKASKESGGDTQQQTKETPNAGRTPDRPRREPSPEAKEWFDRNKTWYLKDPVMTAVANAIDTKMTRDEGMNAETDPDYFEELDRRIRAELPHKFHEEKRTQTAGSGKTGPTIQNRGNPPPTSGKVRVTITAADREMARHLNISIEDYAREKAKRERAMNTATQYTEI